MVCADHLVLRKYFASMTFTDAITPYVNLTAEMVNLLSGWNLRMPAYV